MKNPIFKAQVDAAFDKTSNADVRRGQEIFEGVKDIGSAAHGLLGAANRGLSKFVDPAGSGILGNSLSSAGEYLRQRPGLAKGLVGTAALAPILGNAFLSSQAHHQRELMDAYAQPDRVITGSLDEFIEKKAELYSMTKEAAKPTPKPPWLSNSLLKNIAQRAARGAGNVARTEARNRSESAASEARQRAADQMKRFQKATEQQRAQHKGDIKAVARSAANAVKKNLPPDPGFWAASGEAMVGGLSKGIGSALGGSLVGLMAHGIGTGVDALRDHFMLDPKRKALVDTLVRTDPVLSDAVERHPDSKSLIRESYGTMERFAPTLSLDINAVRSFLREAVLGGSGVNYATIKNLVDTEKSIAEAKPRYGQGH